MNKCQKCGQTFACRCNPLPTKGHEPIPASSEIKFTDKEMKKILKFSIPEIKKNI